MPGVMPTDAGVGLLLGIDPGLAATGWGLIDRDHRVVGCGTFRTPPGPSAPRLLRIVRELQDVLASQTIAEAALEELFMGRNATSAIGVAQARGAILVALAGANIPVHEYTPAHIKATVTGYGGARKSQMARMLTLQGIRPPAMDEHAADAVAVAICHARSRRLRVSHPPPPPGRVGWGPKGRVGPS
jgi:crossover junction endodeoxyribonuclease RuvC